jgi:DNA polymerase-3 subunit alpha
VIIQMGFAGYFLIVSDFMKWAVAHDIPVGPGTRDPGAGSLVAWVLLITGLDSPEVRPDLRAVPEPRAGLDARLRHRLLPERRDEVITYVQQRYGRDRVAQIITFGTLQARGRPARRWPRAAAAAGPGGPPGQDGAGQPRQPGDAGQGHRDRAAPAPGPDEDEAVARLLDIALQLEGSTATPRPHAAGVVISDRPLTPLSPLYRDPRSELPATQFNMKWVESAGW